MTSDEFARWMAKYKKRFLGPGENDDFVLEWRAQLLLCDFADAVAAIADVGADLRERSGFPRQHLPLLLEYADQRQRDRQAKENQLKPWPKENPPPGEAWDNGLLKRGIIDQKEYNRRRKGRAS